MKKRILFLSYNHPDLKVADSVQNHRLIEALQEYYDITILRREKTTDFFGINSLNLNLLDRVLYKLFPGLLSIFSIDRFVWAVKAYNKTKRVLDDYDYLFITYEPYSVYYYQRFVRKTSSIKTVSILYDPYVNNIFLSPKTWSIYFRKKIEKWIVENSDYCVVNNERLYRLFLKEYSNNNISVIPLCGITNKKDCPVRINEKVRIIHAGNIYGLRRIDEINDVISLLKKEIDCLKERVEFLFFGTYLVGYDKVIERGNDDVIIKRNPINSDMLVEEICKSDILLLVDPIDSKNYCFPSKLCEYYQYNKPIIGISGKGTPSYESLVESNHFVCDESGINDLCVRLKEIILNRGSNLLYDKTYYKRFEPNNVASLFYKLLDNNGSNCREI